MVVEEKTVISKAKEKIPYRVMGTITFKIFSLVGIMIFTALLAASIICATVMYRSGVFEIGYSEKDIIFNKLGNQGWNDAYRILNNYIDDDIYYLEYIVDNSNIMCVEISYAGNTGYYDEYGYYYATQYFPDYDVVYTYGDKGDKSTFYNYEAVSWACDENSVESTYLCNIYIDPDLPIADDYSTSIWLMRILCKLRYGIFALGIAFGIAIMFLFVELMTAMGHTSGTTEIHPAFDAKFPFDLLTVIMFAGCYGAIYLFDGIFTPIIFTVLSSVLAETMLLLWCMSFASRIKNHDLVKSLLITKILTVIVKLLKYVPVVWKLTLIGIAFAASNTFLVFWMASGRRNGFWVERDIAFVLWVILTVVEIFALIYIGVMLKRLQKSAKDMAEGKSDAVVNDKWMLPVFKEHAFNLKSIQEGMNIAMEKRISSEKMQAQLITNVSHDIKTPLTSIINYSDLICKEESENEKINEYAEVLGRQSKKLKRLLEDIVEASKASSGNLEVNCVPCTAGNLVIQAAGEYEERLSDAGLELVTKNTDSDIKIMADPRRMWRVFDNLLGNICKYAQPNTRVYLNIEEESDKCFIVFKNTSAQELDINPDELMERFVRGDRSRNTEGNGLGMSIAQNMVSLQGGQMRVCIDGDLFKVILEFPLIKAEQDKNV